MALTKYEVHIMPPYLRHKMRAIKRRRCVKMSLIAALMLKKCAAFTRDSVKTASARWRRYTPATKEDMRVSVTSTRYAAKRGVA